MRRDAHAQLAAGTLVAESLSPAGKQDTYLPARPRETFFAGTQVRRSSRHSRSARARSLSRVHRIASEPLSLACLPPKNFSSPRPFGVSRETHSLLHFERLTLEPRGRGSGSHPPRVTVSLKSRRTAGRRAGRHANAASLSCEEKKNTKPPLSLSVTGSNALALPPLGGARSRLVASAPSAVPFAQLTLGRCPEIVPEQHVPPPQHAHHVPHHHERRGASFTEQRASFTSDRERTSFTSERGSFGAADQQQRPSFNEPLQPKQKRQHRRTHHEVRFSDGDTPRPNPWHQPAAPA